jgi:hypothetical protein
MLQTRILHRSYGLAVLDSQVYKEHSLWQNRAYRSPGTTIAKRAAGRSSVWSASCRHVDFELCAGTAMYRPGPRHQICFFLSLRLSLFRAASIRGARLRLTTSHIVK